VLAFRKRQRQARALYQIGLNFLPIKMIARLLSGMQPWYLKSARRISGVLARADYLHRNLLNCPEDRHSNQNAL
jgi:hypothetical protein